MTLAEPRFKVGDRVCLRSTQNWTARPVYIISHIYCWPSSQTLYVLKRGRENKYKFDSEFISEEEFAANFALEKLVPM